MTSAVTGAMYIARDAVSGEAETFHVTDPADGTVMEPHSGSRTTSSPPARQSSPRPRSSRSVRHQGLLRNQLTWGYAFPDRAGRVFNEMWSWRRATV